MIRKHDRGPKDMAAYYLTPDIRLRTTLAQSTLVTIQGRTPPVRLVVPGRVFLARGWAADSGIVAASEIKIGHVCHVTCIEEGFRLRRSGSLRP